MRRAAKACAMLIFVLCILFAVFALCVLFPALMHFLSWGGLPIQD